MLFFCSNITITLHFAKTIEICKRIVYNKRVGFNYKSEN